MPRWIFALAALAACHSSSDKPAEKQAAPDDKDPCAQLRPLLLEVDRETLDHDAWTQAKPEAQKQLALTEGVEAALAVCVADHWSAQTIRCILDSHDGTAQERCGLSAAEDHRADAATEAVYNRIFGPHP
jgi:hypothetical protein